jgi:hypothetical protein
VVFLQTARLPLAFNKHTPTPAFTGTSWSTCLHVSSITLKRGKSEQGRNPISRVPRVKEPREKRGMHLTMGGAGLHQDRLVSVCLPLPNGDLLGTRCIQKLVPDGQPVLNGQTNEKRRTFRFSAFLPPGDAHDRGVLNHTVAQDVQGRTARSPPHRLAYHSQHAHTARQLCGGGGKRLPPARDRGRVEGGGPWCSLCSEAHDS